MSDFEFSQLQGKIAAQESEIANLRAEVAKLQTEMRRTSEELTRSYLERFVLEGELTPLRDFANRERLSPGHLAQDPDEIEPNTDTGC